ncbi:MAG: UUP1 family membrane protein [Pseudomonadota bacterium]|nr:UUP1 family membrane protein [Pseudomonadota bacterium]
MSKRHLYLLTGLLGLTGAALFLYKAFVLGFPLLSSTKSDFWKVEAKLTISAADEPIKAILAIPRSSSRFAVVNENFVSRGFGLTTGTVDGTRQATWSKRNAPGRHTFYYTATIHQLGSRDHVINTGITPEIEPPDYNEQQQQAAEILRRELYEQSADTDSLIRTLLKRAKFDSADENLRTLVPVSLSLADTLAAISRLLNYAGIAARPVHGIAIGEDTANAAVHDWLEVYDKGWRAYDFKTLDHLSGDYLTWWRGERDIIKLKGAHLERFNLSTSRSQETALKSALLSGAHKNPLWQSFSLASLPLDTQHVYRIVLMIPIGALLLVLLRNVIGIKTFGTFMPILIALAFRETQLLWGVIFFILIVGVGLSIRFYLEHLKLLLVPRLASVLTIVILLMMLVSIITNRMDIERGLSVALFPMVILAMTIERMSIVWEERGAAEAIQQGLGSLLVAALAYLLMTSPQLVHLFFTFPELTLLVLALIMLMGRYSGYRLTELVRFREFY